MISTIVSYTKLTSGFAADPLILYASIGVIVVASIHLYLNHKFSYWEKQGIKGPKPQTFVGNTWELLTKSILDVDFARAKEYGKVVGLYHTTRPDLMILEPEMLKDVLVRDFSNFHDRRRQNGPVGHDLIDKFLVELDGPEWKRMRMVMSPTFTSGKMKAMFELINSCCDPLKETVRNYARNNKDVDVKRVFGCYTMDVIAKCCFATETDSHKDPNNIFLQMARRFFDSFTFSKMLVRFFVPIPIKKLIGWSPNPPESLEFFENLTKALIEKRRKEKVTSKDYLQLLIDSGKEIQAAQEETTVDNEAHHGYEEKTGDQTSGLRDPEKRSLTDLEIVANAVLFLAVGYETTGSLLTFSAYCLALNPDVQETLYQELKQAYEADNRSFQYTRVSGLKYLDAFISETLRMYPPATRIERRSDTNYKFACNGVVVPKGSHVHVPIYAIHHTSDFWPEPEKFDPTRFLPENKHKIIPYTYVPFSAGPRNCIGMRFALLEAKLALANLVLNFKFKKSPNTQVPLDFSSAKVLLTAKEVIVGVDERY